ncbi:MAG: hypothetical protein NTY33_02705 [Candidatus Moranbacteria bacterium]|nr:hypothetical protein [Candidatus Moranbacteria bacterium]
MSNLELKLNKIQKSYFSFADARKIADLDDGSLRVAISRLVKAGKIIALIKGYYCQDLAKVDFPKLALEIYAPSYLSFEWALGQTGVLSQKSYALTLATTKRAHQVEITDLTFIYRHLRADLFFGYEIKEGYLIAQPEKAFLDLAYLSLNGYAKFDAEEMDLTLLDKNKLRSYLKKFKSKRLNKLIGALFA